MGLIIDPFVGKIIGVERKKSFSASSNQSDGTNGKDRVLHVPPHSQTPLYGAAEYSYARPLLQTSHTVNYGLPNIDYCLRCTFNSFFACARVITHSTFSMNLTCRYRTTQVPNVKNFLFDKELN